MESRDLSEYPVSHAAQLVEIKNALWSVTNAALALPMEKVDSVESKAVALQLGRLLRVLERRGITPVVEEE